MAEAIFLSAAIILVISLIALSVYFTCQPRFGPWERLMKCQEMSEAMAETAVFYQKMGMPESANECWMEAQRLNEEVQSIIGRQFSLTDIH